MSLFKRSGTLAILLLVTLFAFAAGAAEFQADMTIQSEQGGDINGKVFVRGSSMRQELETPMGEQVVIVDGDAEIMYVLLPAQKMYVQRDNTQVVLDDSEDPEKRLAAQGKVTKMGTEKIQNYDCDKYHVVNNDKNMGESTLWISRELNYPLKVYVDNPKDKATIIYSNIVEKKLEDHLFVLPSDYSKLEM